MKWTSILRRMPYADTIVMIHVPQSSEPVWLGYFDDEDQKWTYPTGQTVDGVVTHWMELPPAPGVKS